MQFGEKRVHYRTKLFIFQAEISPEKIRRAYK